MMEQIDQLHPADSHGETHEIQQPTSESQIRQHTSNARTEAEDSATASSNPVHPQLLADSSNVRQQQLLEQIILQQTGLHHRQPAADTTAERLPAVDVPTPHEHGANAAATHPPSSESAATPPPAAENNARVEHNNNVIPLPQHPLFNVRDRLFHALFYRMATVYARAVPPPFRMALECCALFKVGVGIFHFTEAVACHMPNILVHFLTKVEVM
jgi:hypothetical protein